MLELKKAPAYNIFGLYSEESIDAAKMVAPLDNVARCSLWNNGIFYEYITLFMCSLCEVRNLSKVFLEAYPLWVSGLLNDSNLSLFEFHQT